MVRWTRYAECLLLFWLIESFTALYAYVYSSIEVSPRSANRQRAFFDTRGPSFWSCSSYWASCTSRLYSLSSECSSWASFAFSINSQLHPGIAFIATFRLWCSFGNSSCLSQSTNLTRERSFIGLIESISTWLTKTCISVQVLSSRTSF